MFKFLIKWTIRREIKKIDRLVADAMTVLNKGLEFAHHMSMSPAVKKQFNFTIKNLEGDVEFLMQRRQELVQKLRTM